MKKKIIGMFAIIVFAILIIVLLLSLRRVNGERVWIKSDAEIKQQLSKVPKTLVTMQGVAYDVTEAIRYDVDDFQVRIGDTSVNVEKSIDSAKLRQILSEVKVGQFRYIDFEMAEKLILDGKGNLDRCIVYKYPVSEIKRYQKFSKFQCSYDKGVAFKDTKKYLSFSPSGEVQVDYSFLDKIISKLEKKYDDYGRVMKVRLHNGKKIVVRSGDSTWQNIIDSEKERAFLKRAFRKGKMITERTPYYKIHCGKQPKTFIEVSKDAQHIWFVKNGKVVMESPVVTGTRGLHDTPSGVFAISEYMPGKFLVGTGYRTWVNRWMRLTGNGVGLHDATWRSAFGGSIYYSSGSHGCINLPVDFAYKLFNQVGLGTFVVVH